LEFGVVKDPLVDLLVVVHASDDGAHEHAVEDKTEVFKLVVAGLRCDFGVGHPGLFELIEQQLVTIVEIGAEPFVECLDDCR
jgi:hypothetical protein